MDFSNAKTKSDKLTAIFFDQTIRTVKQLIEQIEKLCLNPYELKKAMAVLKNKFTQAEKEALHIIAGEMQNNKELFSYKLPCVLIQAGYTKSANHETEFEGKKIFVRCYYSSEMLQTAVENGLFEGVPMLLRSSYEHSTITNTRFENVGGVFLNTKYNKQSESVEGVLYIRPGGEMALKHWYKNNGIALSFTGSGKFILQHQPELNEVILFVNNLKTVYSVDPVVNGANAGGYII